MTIAIASKLHGYIIIQCRKPFCQQNV